MSENSNLGQFNPDKSQMEADISESSGEIRHVNFVIKTMRALHLDENSADVFLLVEGSRLPAHKAILAAS